MTVVEFFACAPIENMVSCFMLNPDKVIFIGGGRRAKRRMSAYEKIAKRMGHPATFLHCSVSVNSINSVVDCLTRIVEEEDDCCFDLTGGDDLALVAMGIVYERFKNTKHLQMQRYNFNSKKMVDCDGDGNLAVKLPFAGITADENVAMHGGVISHGVRTSQLGDSSDVDALWKICRFAPNEWNKDIAKLSELMCVASISGDGLSVYIDDKQAAARFPDYPKRKKFATAFLKKLAEEKLVLDLKNEDKFLSYIYKNSLVKRILLKCGNALEYKMLSVASNAKDAHGNKVFADAVCGAVIDWDGLTVGPKVSFGGTVNEIDLLVMKGLTPVFVSCKNGGVDEEELYKLNTVAARFGNRYAKKLLVASGLNKTGQGLEYFKMRAADMNIMLVENAHRLTDKELENILLKI